MSKPPLRKILILCTGNSCRSQMAEGLLYDILLKQPIPSPRQTLIDSGIFTKNQTFYYASEYEVCSAGVDPERVNLHAIHVMKEIDIDISHHQSTHVNQYADVFFDYVITVCDSAKEKCPIHFKANKIIHKSFLDPAQAKGTNNEILKVYSEVRDALKEYLTSFFHEELAQNK